MDNQRHRADFSNALQRGDIDRGISSGAMNVTNRNCQHVATGAFDKGLHLFRFRFAIGLADVIIFFAENRPQLRFNRHAIRFTEIDSFTGESDILFKENAAPSIMTEVKPARTACLTSSQVFRDPDED